jgi:hypothetical protein
MPSSLSIWTRFLGPALAACALTFTGNAHADTMIIRNPGDHSRYSFEAEPHLLLGLIDPGGAASGTGIGAGFRGTVVLLQNGFVPSINNSIGIGFGADLVHYAHGAFHCSRDPLTSGVSNCNYDDSVNDLWFPVVMQWNFFLSRQWSVFGEPGLAARYEGYTRSLNIEPTLYLGGRWHFSDQMALTMRLGYPTFSVGVSFM